MFSRMGRCALTLLILLAVASCSEEPGTPKDTAVAQLKRAESYLAQGQFNAAIIEIKNALQKNQGIDAYLLLAQVYLQQGNYASAAKILQDLPQDDLRVATRLGEAYLHQGKFKSLHTLLQPFEQKTEARNDTDFTLLLARSLALQSRFDESIRVLDALATQQTQPALQAQQHLVRAMIWDLQKNTARQREALDAALRADPRNVDAMVEIARIELDASQYEAAEDLLSQALIALPTTDTMTLKRLHLLQAMVTTLSRQGRSAEALVYSKLIADANPKAQEIQVEFQSALDALKAGKIQDAEATLSRLYNSENTSLAGSLLGMIKFQQGDFRDAAQLLEDTIDLETASPETLRAYAESQLRLQNPQQALKAIEANVKENPDDPDLLGVYGLSLLATGQQDKGIDILKTALKVAPDRFRLRLALADTFNRRQQWPEALEQLETALRAQPDDILLQERLIKQYRFMKKNRELGTLVDQLARHSAPQSQALAGLALLGTDTRRAEQLLDKAYAAAPTDTSVLRAQIARHALAKDYAGILRAGKELVALNPDDLLALSAVLRAEIALNNESAGVRYLEELSQNTTNAWGPDFVLAQQGLAAGKLEQAKKHADVALARSAFNPSTTQLATRISLYSAQQQAADHQLAAARETLLEGLQVAPAHPELMQLLVAIELEDKNLKAAAKLVDELQKAAPDSYSSHMASGDLATAQGDPASAATHYQSAWTLRATDRAGNLLWSRLQKASDAERSRFLAEWEQRLPQSHQVKTITGMYWQSQGKRTEAREAYRKSLALDPKQSAVLNNLAWLLLEENDPKGALQHARDARDLNPDNPSILDTYGWIALQNGDRATALEALEKAASLLPDNAEITSHLAQARQKP